MTLEGKSIAILIAPRGTEEPEFSKPKQAGHLEEPSDYVQLGAGGGGSGRVVPIPLHRSADFLDGADR
jgi:protease I